MFVKVLHLLLLAEILISVSVALDCSPISNSVPSPTGCSCFALYTDSKTWNNAFTSCQNNAPAGFVGRLAFADDQETYDILRGLSTGRTWFGLKTPLATHSMPMDVTEWWWYEGDVAVMQLSFIPSVGESLSGPSQQCMYYDAAGLYEDYPCDIAYPYYCEFLEAEADCSAIPGSIPLQGTSSCFAHYSNKNDWDTAFSLCQSAAPAGFTGRLAFGKDQAAYDLLRSLSTGNSWVGLKSTVPSHALTPMNVNEWAWYEGAVLIDPLTFIPPVGESIGTPTELCVYYDTTGLYEDYSCTGGLTDYSYFCEFVQTLGNPQKAACSNSITTPATTASSICSVMSDSILSPIGCSCLAYYSDTKSWDNAFTSCQGKAPIGFIGRLAFADDQETFDMLRTLSTGITWVGLKTPLTSHQIFPMDVSEWSWYEGGVAVMPLTFIPSVGESLSGSSQQCVYYDTVGRYEDYTCSAPWPYYCEFVQVGADCSAIPSSIRLPGTSSCFAHYTDTKNWDNAFISCQSKAPANFIGRLAFGKDQAAYDLLRSLYTGNSWVGLKSTVPSHALTPMNVNEWAWYEGAVLIDPLTFIPPVGESIGTPTELCVYYDTVGRYEDISCTGGLYTYFCEFVQSTGLKPVCGNYTEMEITTAADVQDTTISGAVALDCSSISNSIPSPPTCSCFTRNTASLQQAQAYSACQSMAPTGFRGRLAFADDQATFDILHTLSSSVGWVGLKSIVPTHQISPMNVNEWAWHEGDVAIKPLTFIPPIGESLNGPTQPCIHYTTNGKYYDASCTITGPSWCEFVQESCTGSLPYATSLKATTPVAQTTVDTTLPEQSTTTTIITTTTSTTTTSSSTTTTTTVSSSTTQLQGTTSVSWTSTSTATVAPTSTPITTKRNTNTPTPPNHSSTFLQTTTAAAAESTILSVTSVYMTSVISTPVPTSSQIVSTIETTAGDVVSTPKSTHLATPAMTSATTLETASTLSSTDKQTSEGISTTSVLKTTTTTMLISASDSTMVTSKGPTTESTTKILTTFAPAANMSTTTTMYATSLFIATTDSTSVQVTSEPTTTKTTTSPPTTTSSTTSAETSIAITTDNVASISTKSTVIPTTSISKKLTTSDQTTALPTMEKTSSKPEAPSTLITTPTVVETTVALTTPMVTSTVISTMITTAHITTFTTPAVATTTTALTDSTATTATTTATPTVMTTTTTATTTVTTTTTTFTTAHIPTTATSTATTTPATTTTTTTSTATSTTTLTSTTATDTFSTTTTTTTATTAAATATTTTTTTTATTSTTTTTSTATSSSSTATTTTTTTTTMTTTTTTTAAATTTTTTTTTTSTAAATTTTTTAPATTTTTATTSATTTALWTSTTTSTLKTTTYIRTVEGTSVETSAFPTTVKAQSTLLTPTMLPLTTLRSTAQTTSNVVSSISSSTITKPGEQTSVQTTDSLTTSKGTSTMVMSTALKTISMQTSAVTSTSTRTSSVPELLLPTSTIKKMDTSSVRPVQLTTPTQSVSTKIDTTFPSTVPATNVPTKTTLYDFRAPSTPSISPDKQAESTLQTSSATIAEIPETTAGQDITSLAALTQAATTTTIQQTTGLTTDQTTPTTTQRPECKFDSASSWSKCGKSCGIQFTRKRWLTSSVKGCTDAKEEVEKCPFRECSKDCTWKAWGKWGLCSVTCGKGTIERYRGIETEAVKGGNPCEGTNMQNKPCQADCIVPTIPPEVESTLTEAGVDEDTLTDSASMSSSVQDSLPFMLESLGDEVKSEMGHSMVETMPLCTYNGEQCDFQKDFKKMYDPAMGNCFTYNYELNSDHMTFRAGSEYGLTILLQGSQSDYLCTSQSAGFKVIIHNATEHPFPDAMGYLIAPGTSSTISLKQNTINRLPPPYGTCRESDDLGDYYYNGTFTVEGCMRSCFQNIMLKSCGCGDPRYPMPKNGTEKVCSVNQKSCLDFQRSCQSDLVESAGCICTNPCTESIFEATLTTAHLKNLQMAENICKSSHEASKDIFDCLDKTKKNFALVKIYYDKLNSRAYTETPAYTIYQLSSDFGGIMGVILGPSAITFVEFFICIVGLVIYTVTSGRVSIL